MWVEEKQEYINRIDRRAALGYRSGNPSKAGGINHVIKWRKRSIRNGV
jgi:hypothetical protein